MLTRPALFQVQLVGPVLRQALAQLGAVAPPLLCPLLSRVRPSGDIARSDAAPPCRRRPGRPTKLAELQKARIDAAPTAAAHEGLAAARPATHAKTENAGIPQHEPAGTGPLAFSIRLLVSGVRLFGIGSQLGWATCSLHAGGGHEGGRRGAWLGCGGRTNREL
jgi:hypothetical protein